jgi:hypothetical protein
VALSIVLRSHLYLAQGTGSFVITDRTASNVITDHNLGVCLWSELAPFAPPSYAQQDIHKDTECQNNRNKHVRNPTGQSEEHDDHAARDEHKERRCPIGDRDAVRPRNWEGEGATGREIDRYKGRPVSSEFHVLDKNK